MRCATSRSRIGLSSPRSTRVGTGIARSTAHQSTSTVERRVFTLGCHAHTMRPSGRWRRLWDATQR